MVIPIEEKSSGLLCSFRVHDMVLSLLRDLSTKENFVVILHGEQRSHAQGKVRRLALQMPLVEETNYKDMPQMGSFNAMIRFTNLIPPICSFKVLRVLVLEYCIGMDGYPLEHIAKLLHLRYIGLSHTPARKLPKEIGRLKFLQTLLLDDTGIEELPASVCLLTQLMCLRADKKTRVRGRIGKLTSLVELELYLGSGNNCSTRQFAKELANLRDLRVLKAEINLQDEGQGRDLLESLRKLPKMQTIAILFPGGSLHEDVVTEPIFALSSSLRILDLLNLQFSRLPTWINAQDLPNLLQLQMIVSDAEEQDMEILGRFRQLRKLVLLILRSRRLKLPVCGCGGFQNLRSLDVAVPLQFAQGAMPRLEHINFAIDVAELVDANIGLDFGLENLQSLGSVNANIECASASPTEVEQAEAAIRRAVDVHTNHPALEVRRVNEDKMELENADSRMFNRLMYKLFQARSLDTQIAVQQDYHSAMYSEATEMARSIPTGHPSVAQISSASMLQIELLQKQLAGTVESTRHEDDSWGLHKQMKENEVKERLLELYGFENQRMAAIVEELKAALSPQPKVASSATNGAGEEQIILLSD